MNRGWGLALTTLLLASCSGSSTGTTEDDGGGSAVGESCITSRDCYAGLTCVNLTCINPRRDGGDDGGRLSGLGESCVRTVDCEQPLRCVNQMCAWSEDGGSDRPDTAGSSSSSGGSDAGRGEGCAEPGETPRGLGGCCVENSECASNLCIAGTCSAECTTDDACAVTAAATPFSAATQFTCGAWPSSTTGRACLPGSLQACVPGGCPAQEACVPIAAGDADGGLVVTLRCTARRVGLVRAGGACESSSDCEVFSPVAENCAQGVCRLACSEGAECAAGEQCTPAAETGPGICHGIQCGDGPSGADALCPEGHVCVPSMLEGDTWRPQCTPRDPTALPSGMPCTPETADQCAHHICVNDQCSRLCRTDEDCTPTQPFCVEDLTTSGLLVAACQAVPVTAQLCRDEQSCGALGCRYLGPRTDFSSCSVGGTSSATDAECGPDRYCGADSVCLPDDVDGTLRCAHLLRVGSECDSDNDCLSGLCIDRDGRISSSSRCSSRCRTAEDCAPGMECRSRITEASGPAPVLHTLCWPRTPTELPCTTSNQCVERMLGDRCDELTGACYTQNASAGSSCSVDEDCTLGLRCGTPAGQQNLCVRDGCIPEMSGGGCMQDEVCVRTSDVTAECRRPCTVSGDCRSTNSELVCVVPASASGPSWCGLPPQ